MFEQKTLDGDPEVFSLDLLEPARRVPVEPSLPHKIGNAALKLLRRPPRPYRPNYSVSQLYKVLSHLEGRGVIASHLEYGRPDPDGWPTKLWHLTDLDELSEYT